jgi:signal transduction histidine kinase/DNA-binding NarL/FixJ family response regulator
MRKSICHIFISSLLLFFSTCDPPQKEKQFTIGFSQCCKDPWRDMMEQEMRMELSFHPEIIFEMAVGNNSSATQIEQIRDLVNKGVDLLIVAPNETEPLTAIVEEVYGKGIPIILIDRKVNSEKFTAFIGADNYQIGKTGGEYLVSKFNGVGKILEIQLSMSISPAIERSRGFRDAIAAFPELEILDAVKTEGNMEKLVREIPDFVAQYPEANIFFGHTDGLCQTAAKVLDTLGIKNQYFLLGVDGTPGSGGGLEAIDKGMLNATMLYPTGGTEVIQLAIKIHKKESFEKLNTLQTTVIDERNIRIMTLQNDKILSQQKNIERQHDKIVEQIKVYSNQRFLIYFLLATLVVVILLGASNLLSLRAKKEANEKLEVKNQEVIQQRNQIMEIAEKARLATEAKVKFFTNISHEFRTPLTLIHGAVDDLWSSEKSREKRKDLGLIRKNSDRLLRLVNQLMDFGKIENDKMVVAASKQDLNSFLKGILEVFEKQSKLRNIDLTFFSREKQIEVWFDRDMMDKVIFNLLSNAFKFTKEGGRIHLIAILDELSNRVVIKVEDNGRGMSKAHAAHAFERFYQGDSYSTQGTGLGLSLSKMLVELHHGDIQVESEEGVGTRFEIQLLLGNAHFTPAEIMEEQPNQLLPGSFENELEETQEEDNGIAIPGIPQEHSVLIIEDNEDLCTFLERKLSPLYEIFQAIDGNQGMNAAFEQIPDLIICDVMMPGKNGIELANILKTDLRTAHIPIILLTARAQREQELEGLKTGADIYLTKPFDFDILKEHIHSLLRNRSALKSRYIGDIAINASPSDKLNKKFISEFKAFVDANYTNPKLDVHDICEALQLSRVQFHK